MAISSALGSSALLPAGLGFRNLLVNGGMDVWQRDTSFTPSANTAVYTADRFGIFRSVSGNHTSTRVASDLPGFNYFNRLGRASGDTATGPLYAGASLETSSMVVPMQGKTIVFSFYARKGSGYSATNSQLTLYFEHGTGTDTAFLTGLTNQVSQTYTLTSSWQRFYFVLPNFPTTSTAVRYYFAYTPTGTANSTDYWDVTGIQLEANTQATPFEQRPFGIELALCQRYYERITNSFYGVGHFYSTTMAYHQLQFNTPKRANASPSFSISSLSDFVVYCAGGGYTPTAMGFENITGKPQVNVVARTTIGTALTAGWSSLLYPAGGTSTGWIAVDCEL